ncbi:MAG TPA: hypothetical protein VN516_10630, partial [Candidatus Baltobacteraceae bacterium]|nr:hypothetical protein [Candidatus Baltobacteraceae bacterium]
AQTVLNFSRDYDLNICRAMAIRYFAGLRTIETERIEEKFIREKFIKVTRDVSKGGRARKPRIITIQPNLREWLNLGGELPVRGCKSNIWRDFTEALRRATGLVWTDNVTRHSFCSYHLARFEKPGKTALESGHTEQILFSNYREVETPDGQLVTVHLARKYFSITPKVIPNALQ